MANSLLDTEDTGQTSSLFSPLYGGWRPGALYHTNRNCPGIRRLTRSEDGAPTEWIAIASPPAVVRVGFSEEGACKRDESGEPGQESGADNRVCKASGDGRPWAVGGGGQPGYRPALIGEPSPASSDHAHFLRVRQPLWGRGHLQVCFTVFVLLAGYSERGP